MCLWQGWYSSWPSQDQHCACHACAWATYPDAWDPKHGHLSVTIHVLSLSLHCATNLDAWDPKHGQLSITNSYLLSLPSLCPSRSYWRTEFIWNQYFHDAFDSIYCLVCPINDSSVVWHPQTSHHPGKCLQKGAWSCPPARWLSSNLCLQSPNACWANIMQTSGESFSLVFVVPNDFTCPWPPFFHWEQKISLLSRLS